MDKAIILFVLATLFFKGFIFIDPDFGWHLKMGELILKQGIPITDPFSYSMPSYLFVDHEWLTNIIFYGLYQVAGRAGLALILAVMAIGSLLIVKPKNQFRFYLAPFLLSFAILLPFFGTRPQVETWFLTAVLLKVISDDRLFQKWRWLFPLYFLLWANLHGGFVGGLAIFFLAVSLKSLLAKKILPGDFILALFCLAATLINPYGFDLWKEIWRSLSDNNLRLSIVEWTPLIFRLDWAFLILLVLSGVLVFRYRSKLATLRIVLYTSLLLAGLSSQRHILLWVLIALPLTAQTLQYFYKEIKSIKLARDRFNKAFRVFLAASFFIFISSIILSIRNLKQLQEGNYYPKQAIQFLKQLSLTDRMFSSYNWGGYLIWKLPQQKVFVDGRMPSWRWQRHPQKESYSAYDEYLKLVNKESTLEILDKYQIQFVLWPTEKKTEQDWRERLLARFFPTQNVIPLEKRMEKAGWQKIYQDPVATLYQRPGGL